MHDGHRERMRKKLLSGDSFYNHEILEMLLYSSNPRKDTNPAAHRLIEQFGSLSEVFDAPFDELIKVEGVGTSSAALIKLIPLAASAYIEGKSEISGNIINSVDAAFNYVKPKYINLTEEMPSALFMSPSGKILAWKKLGEGTVNITEIPIRKIVSAGIKCNASQVIVFHNHPSGVAVPSNSDVICTREIAQALKPIGIHIIDHIIIAGNDYVSLAQSSEFSFIFN